MQQSASHEYAINHLKVPYLQLGIIIAGVFMAILDTSIVNVAIPTMEAELSASTDQIQWVLTGYMLTLGVLIPISGWLTDFIGAKKLFLFALGIFTIGSALCGMAWNLDAMIGFRIIQAIGGAFMQPVAMAMIFKIFPPERRGVIMGMLGISMMAAPAFGPLLSGYFVDYASWRLIFYINVPIGIAAVMLGIPFLYEFPHKAENKLDIFGLFTSCIGFFSMLYGVNEVATDGWGSLTVILSLVIGGVFILFFILIELSVKNPMLNMRVLKNYMFSMSLVLTSIIYTAMFVGIFLLPIYLQNIMGYTAFRTGMFMTPAAIGSAIMMPISGRLFNRTGARPLGLVGLLIITISTFGFTTLDLNSSAMQIQILYIFRSIGMGLAMMPIMTAGMNTVPLNLVSQGTAMTNTVRQVASSFGTALLTSYLTTQETLHAEHMAWRVVPYNYQGTIVVSLQRLFQHLGDSLTQSQQAAIGVMEELISKQAFVAGMNDTFFVATVLTGIAWALMWFYYSKKEREIRLGRSKQKVKAAAPREQVAH